MNLINLLNQSPYVFYLLVVDKFLDINLPQLKNLKKIYLSDYPSVKVKNSGKLLSHPQVIKYIYDTSQKLKLTPAIIPFKPSAKIDFICRKHGWINVSNSAKINRFFEDKLWLPQTCFINKIPILPYVIHDFNKKIFNQAQEKLGQKLVIQTHFGWAGKSTFLAEKWEDVKNIIPINSNVKYSPFLQGYTLLNNCCLTKYGLIQSPPALQFTGIKPLTNNPFTTVGRQWPCLAPKSIQQKIYEISQNFSEILKQYQYKGFFGLDFLVSEDQVYLLECNPRLTASYDIYTQIEIKNKLTPLFLFHLAEFINLDSQIDISSEQQHFFNPKIIGSEIVLKNKQNNTIKKYYDFIPFSNTVNPISIKPEIIKLISPDA